MLNTAQRFRDDYHKKKDFRRAALDLGEDIISAGVLSEPSSMTSTCCLGAVQIHRASRLYIFR
jgi:hypothetical protein